MQETAKLYFKYMKNEFLEKLNDGKNNFTQKNTNTASFLQKNVRIKSWNQQKRKLYHEISNRRFFFGK